MRTITAVSTMRNRTDGEAEIVVMRRGFEQPSDGKVEQRDARDGCPEHLEFSSVG